MLTVEDSTIVGVFVIVALMLMGWQLIRTLLKRK